MAIPCLKRGVTTSGDECSRVGLKHGESPSPKYQTQKEADPMLDLNSTYYSANCGPVRILKALPNDKYTIQYENTGTVAEARGFAIKRGEIRDPYARLNCGVACTGNIKTKGKNAQLYNVWNSMIHRCYSDKDKRAKAYKNVTVCERWLVFENFADDYRNVDGFDGELFKSGSLVLDKDLKQRYAINKIYSPETCTWVTKDINNRIQDGQMKKFKAVDSEGIIYISDNITAFAKEHNLLRQRVQDVLHKRSSFTKGWTFEFLDEDGESLKAC